jgi:hypothetical protein
MPERHTIMRELNEELRIGLVNDEELASLCRETLEISATMRSLIHVSLNS